MTAHRGCMNIVTESAFKVDSGRTDPLSHLYEYCTWRFGPNHWAVPPQCTCLTKPAHFSCVSLTSRWQPLTTHTYTKHAAYYTHTHTPSMLLTTHTHTPSMLLTTHTHTPSMLLTTHTPSMLLTAHMLSMLISWQGRQWIPQCHTSPPSPTVHLGPARSKFKPHLFENNTPASITFQRTAGLNWRRCNAALYADCRHMKILRWRFCKSSVHIGEMVLCIRWRLGHNLKVSNVYWSFGIIFIIAVISGTFRTAAGLGRFLRVQLALYGRSQL